MGELLLVAAARKGNLDRVRELLAQGCPVDEKGEPLTPDELKSAKYVIGEANTETAAESIRRAFDTTPLMAAAEEGHLQIVETLLAAGADVNAEDSFKRRAIMLAIRWKHEAIARLLLDAGSDPNAKDLAGEPVLTQAIGARLWPLAHALLDAGALPQPRAKKDCLPLNAASYATGDEGASLLLRLLDLKAKPADSKFVARAVERQSVEVIRRILKDFPELSKNCAPGELLERAAKRRDIGLIDTLLEFGLGPTNLPDEPSPLSAVIIGPPRLSLHFHLPEYRDDPREIACLDALVAAGADVNHACGGVPLSWAISFRRSGLFRWLLDHGADPTAEDHGESLLDEAKEQLAESEPYERQTEEERAESLRQQDELKKIIAMLEEAVKKLPKEASSKKPPAETKETRPQPSRLEQSLAIPATPVARRRGLCAATFFKAEQVLVRADIDQVSKMFAKDKKVKRVERDMFRRRMELTDPAGDILAIIKLKGHDWIYIAGIGRATPRQTLKQWSKSLKAPVLCAGEESTASVVYYMLYDKGDPVESFESDGQWFRGGVEIDPEVEDPSDQMAGTNIRSFLRATDRIDWSRYESEYEFLDAFLREQDAYLTFFYAGFYERGKPLEVSAFHDDEFTSAAIERMDLVFYKPTPQQTVAASQPDPKEDRLLQAIKSNDEAGVAAAIAAGADVNAPVPQNRSSYLALAIGYAGLSKSEQIIDRLLASGADPNHGGDEPMLLKVATRAGTDVLSMRVLRKLLEAGADVNVRLVSESPNPFLPGGKTPLIQLAHTAKLNYIKLLLKRGADPSLKDDTGRNALDYAERWVREVKKDQLKDVPSFTDETYLPRAKDTVELLESALAGTLDVSSLPDFDELIAAEQLRLDERKRLGR